MLAAPTTSALFSVHKSPRHLEIAEASELARHARGKIKIVALTVDADDATLGQIIDEVSPDFLQLHGNEIC